MRVVLRLTLILFFTLLSIFIITAQSELTDFCDRLSDEVPTMAFDRAYYHDQIESYSDALSEQDDAEVYTLRGDAYYAIGDLDNALLDFLQATELDPESSYAYARLGDTYQRLFDVESAFSAYNSALNLDPEYAYVYVKRGILYRKLGYIKGLNLQSPEYILALNDFNTAVELDASLSLVYIRRSELFTSVSELGLALEDAQLAVRVDPLSVFAHITLANVYRDVGENKRAFEMIEKALTLDTDRFTDYAYAYSSRGEMCRRLGVFDQAQADAEQALEFDDDYALTYLHLMRIANNLGRTDEAIEYLMTSINLNPVDPYAYSWLDYYQIDRSLYADSREVYQTWLDYSVTMDDADTPKANDE